MIEKQYAFSKDAVTVTQVVANLGALSGGALCGWASQIFGRRFTIIVMSIIGGAILYPYTFVSSKKIMAAAFFEQFCVQGAWGGGPRASDGAFSWLYPHVHRWCGLPAR